MPHYKDLNNGLHFIDDASFAHYLPEGCVKITDEEADALHPTPSESTYAELRAAEYPDFRNYLDGVVKNDQAQIDAYIAACQAVKDKYPKA
jgi:hypothetical protein